MAAFIKFSKDETGELMEHLYKAKKHIKKLCEIIEEGEEGSRRGGGRMGRREHSRFEDDEDTD